MYSVTLLMYIKLEYGKHHRCQNGFLLFKKTHFLMFLFFGLFYFLVAKIYNSTKPAKLLHKTNFKRWI